MMFNSHEEEERLLRDAKRLRRQAQAMREARLKEREKAARANEQRQKEIAGAEKKRRRDEEIRAFLLPLAESFKRTGWRIKTPNAWGFESVLTLTRSNQHPPEEIKIYWKDPGLTNQMGFYWE